MDVVEYGYGATILEKSLPAGGYASAGHGQCGSEVVDQWQCGITDTGTKVPDGLSQRCLPII
jgi:hypothetical protein